MRDLMADPMYMMGTPVRSDIVLAILSFTIVMMGYVTQYQDMSNTLHFYPFLYRLKYRTMKYPLNDRNWHKLAVRLNTVTKYVMINSLAVTITATVALFCV